MFPTNKQPKSQYTMLSKNVKNSGNQTKLQKYNKYFRSKLNIFFKKHKTQEYVE